MKHPRLARRQRTQNEGDEVYSSLMSNENALEQSESLLGFLEFMAEGVMVLDNSRIIRAINSSLVRMFGWSEADLVGKLCLDIFGCQHPDSATSLCVNLCPLMNIRALFDRLHPINYHEISMLTKSGERREVSASFAPLSLPFLTQTNAEIRDSHDKLPLTLPNKVPAYSIIVLRDITDLKRQDRIKSQFIATASHQLRTPLSSIKTSIGLLLASVGEDFSDPLRRLLLNIQVSSMRMERLVNDMIELTNLQSGRVKMQRNHIEVRDLVDKAVNLIRANLENKKQILKLDLPTNPVYLDTDYGRISQVLGHLLSNASKFSASGGELELQVYSVTQDGQTAFQQNEAIFCVRDSGIGISIQEQSMIFEKFYQSQVAENSNEVGGGLGLPMAKALVELNGGRLWFESEPGKGSKFYFSLPSSG
ncbi:PAS domain-containing sensor histidine kinase [Candidatus Chlorohelix sp.]|uniref:PAS domain-containing sensor histidine kinase n=1 Tax=Candidatus Chlorohelix sp. TaxID=3139201 RepID=UPI0031456526